jgi:hypothetical protein
MNKMSFRAPPVAIVSRDQTDSYLLFRARG